MACLDRFGHWRDTRTMIRLRSNVTIAMGHPRKLWRARPWPEERILR